MPIQPRGAPAIDRPRVERHLGAAAFYEFDARPAVTYPWPHDGLALVGLWYPGADKSRWPASVALYDPAQRRFLTGGIEIGHGAISRIRPDGQGRLLVLLPWAGQLGRVSPAD